LKPIQALIEAKFLKGAAHITGGGLTDNIPRILPRGLGVEIDPSSWPTQPIFELLKKLGNVPDEDHRRTFNLGVGMVLVVAEKKIGFVSKLLRGMREPFYQIGLAVPHSGKQSRVKYL
jgi:phosphoribosylaminoimidazole (AIR) synthetase